MPSVDLAALFFAAVGFSAWVNARTVRLPHGIAMMFVGIAGALTILALKGLRPDLARGPVAAIDHVDFARTVLGYMLAFLLFAGAMQVDLAELRRRRLSIWTLATLGVLASTGIVGVGLWLAARALRVEHAAAVGGLHGALSLALALSIPPGPQRPVILAATYAVAAFSIVVQGLTFAPLAQRLHRPDEAARTAHRR